MIGDVGFVVEYHVGGVLVRLYSENRSGAGYSP